MQRYTAKRGHCGATTSVLAANTWTNFKHEVHGWAQAYIDSNGTILAMSNGGLMIACRGCTKPVRASRVHGVVKAHIKCNAKCQSSKGHSCECSCGGRNHGAGFEA